MYEDVCMDSKERDTTRPPVRGEPMSKWKKNGFAKDGWIQIRGARTHNLKDINVSIPRGKFVVISGVSGSGNT